MFVLCLATVASAQTFEVASVKVSPADSRRGSEGGPGSKDPLNYRFISATLQDFIAIGYDVGYSQISSKTALDSTRFDLVAKLPAGATKADFRAMMRTMLAERFRFKAHQETKEFPGFDLILAKNGPKLPQPAHSMEGFPQLPPDRPGFVTNFSMSGGYILVRARAQQQTMPDLAKALGRSVENTPVFVLDHTGLDGKFDFTLEFTREVPAAREAPPEPATVPTIFTALQQQLGLQLVSKKIPLPVVVVESFEKLPTEN